MHEPLLSSSSSSSAAVLSRKLRFGPVQPALDDPGPTTVLVLTLIRVESTDHDGHDALCEEAGVQVIVIGALIHEEHKVD